MNLIRNLFGSKIARSSRNNGFFGKLAKLGLAKRVSTGRGLSGKLSRAHIGAKQAGLGFGVLAGLGALVAGSIFGVKRLTSSRSHESTGSNNY